jgi:hypothetical protein
MAAPTIYTVLQILDAAKLAGGYAAIDRAICEQNNTSFPEPLISEKIQFVRKRVQYRYDINPNDSTLRDTANLLWSLLGKYGLRAINSLQMGGIVVNSTTNVASYLTVLKDYPQFVVADSGTPIISGGSTLTIVDPLIVPESLLGSVEVHADGSEQAQYLSDRASFTPVYSTGQYVITWNVPILAGTVMQIKYPVRQNLVYAASDNVVVDDTYTAVLNGVQTKQLLNLAGNIFTITAGTQGQLNINLAGQDQSNNTFAGYWQYYVNNVGGVITLALSSGGIYQPYSGGDINANISITGNNTLQGVQVEVTGFSGKTITVNANFTYNSFSL